MVSGGSHGRGDGGGGSCTPENAGVHYEGVGMVMAGGYGGGGVPWDPIRNSRIPWTAATRSLMDPLICSGV